jgi:hypothetical protein
VRAVLIVAGFAVAAIAAVGISQIGGDEDAPEPSPAPPLETADALPALPRGWKKAVNPAGGFAIGVPPGWSVKSGGAKTTLKAPGSPVVVSITADRTGEALEADLQAYATGVASRLQPDRVPVPLADPPAPRDPAYQSAGATTAANTAGKGGERRIEVIVVRRTAIAAFPVLVASDAAVKPNALDPIVHTLVGSIRGRPVVPAA